MRNAKKRLLSPADAYLWPLYLLQPFVDEVGVEGEEEEWVELGRPQWERADEDGMAGPRLRRGSGGAARAACDRRGTTSAARLRRGATPAGHGSGGARPARRGSGGARLRRGATPAGHGSGEGRG